MLIKLDDSIYAPFTTRDPNTGNAADADALPTAYVENEDGTTGGLGAVTVNNIAGTGQYNATIVCNTGNGFVVGNRYHIRATATVTGAGPSTVTDTAVVASFEMSAGSHGKVIGSGVPEIGAGQPNGLVICGTNAAIEFVSSGVAFHVESTGDVGFHVESSANFGMLVESSTTHGLYCYATGVGNAGAGIRAEGAGGAGYGFQGINANSGEHIWGVWNYAPSGTINASKTMLQVLCMAAGGAGAGTVDTSVLATTTRNETFRYLDGSDAFIVAADINGNRVSVNLNPP